MRISKSDLKINQKDYALLATIHHPEIERRLILEKINNVRFRLLFSNIQIDEIIRKKS